MLDVLFINHCVVNCGVYQYGLRLYSVLTRRQRACNFRYAEVDSLEAYHAVVDSSKAKVHMFNYHCSTMPWLNSKSLRKGVVNVGLPHESSWTFSDTVIDIDPTGGAGSIPRPLYEVCPTEPSDACPESVRDFIEYRECDAQSGKDVPVFGSFGFGFHNKGFHRIIEKVNAEYDRAIIKLVIPVAHFDPNRLATVQYARFDCESVPRKAGIKLLITHDFLSNEDMLVFLSRNSMNVFMYDTMHGRGISSVIDYALSVKRPIAISDSHMFRHIYNDDVCAYKRTLAECMECKLVDTVNPQMNNEALVRKVEALLEMWCSLSEVRV